MPGFNPRLRDLVSLLGDAVDRHGPRPLFGERRGGRWTFITYAEFARQVDALRAGLARLGVGKGDRVAIISGNSVPWAVGCYASLGLGAIWVPMYEAQQDRERQFILQNSEAKVCFVPTQELAGRVLAMKPSLPALRHVVCVAGPPGDSSSLTALLAAGAQAPRAARVPDPSETAAIVYTSGTTGEPKGVVLSHSNLACNVAAGLEVFRLEPHDRSLSFLPWAHLFGQTVEVHTIIGAGASTALCRGVPQLMDDLVEVRPTLLVAVPAIFSRIYAAVRKKMAESPAPMRRLFAAGQRVQARMRQGGRVSVADRLALALIRRLVYSRIVARFGGRLKFAVSAGAALPREVAEFVDGLGITVCEGYGLTETSPGAALNTPTDRRLGSVGKAIPGVTVALDESKGTEPGEGEIIVRGHNVMQGYYKLPEETAHVLSPDGGFRTGDLGRIDADGFIYVTGRVKELYKLDNGKYVAPVPLEEKLGLSLFISQVMVYGENRPCNVAVVVPDLLMLRAQAAQRGVAEGEPQRLAHDQKAREILRAEIDRQGRDFKAFEKIRDFIVAGEAFTVENDLLTPKLSIKRRNVVERYRQQIEEIYRRIGRPAAPLSPPAGAFPPGPA
jgi:long-chain acyl-CoA synthetase